MKVKTMIEGTGLLAIFAAAALIMSCGGSGGDGGGGGPAAVFPAGAAIERVSISTGDTQGNDHSPGDDYLMALSADGRYAAFCSSATNLVADDANGLEDVFVRDRLRGVTSRVSVSSGGTEANSFSFNADISGNGRYVVFSSPASNLVPGDANGGYDIFVHDRIASKTSRVSVSSGGTEGNSSSTAPSISADGRFVSFASSANNLVANDTNILRDVFVHDRQTGETTRVSVSSGGTQANNVSDFSSMSADGRYVAFESYASNLVSNDSNGQEDVFVHDLQTGETRLVSVSSGNTPGDGHSSQPSISADGRYVAFQSMATNLVADDANGQTDVFVRDLQTGVTTRASVMSGGTEGSNNSGGPSISDDGRYVVFYSNSNLEAGYSKPVGSVFVHDNVTGITLLASKNAADEQNVATADWARTAISADGNYVLFSSAADNLVADDTNGDYDVFAAPNPALP